MRHLLAAVIGLLIAANCWSGPAEVNWQSPDDEEPVPLWMIGMLLVGAVGYILHLESEKQSLEARHTWQMRDVIEETRASLAAQQSAIQEQTAKLRVATEMLNDAQSILRHWKDVGISYRDGAISDEELLQQIDGLLTMEELTKQQGY